MVFRVIISKFPLRRSILTKRHGWRLVLAGISHERQRLFFRRLDHPGRHPRRSADRRGASLAARGLSFQPATGPRLLLATSPLPPPAPLRLGPQGRPDRTPHRVRTSHCLQAPGLVFQGSHPVGTATPGRTPLWQAPATLRWTRRTLPLRKPRRDSLRHTRLSRTHL